MERKQPSKGHSLPGDCGGGDKSGHRKKVTEQGALTPWRPQRGGQVRTQKESDQARGTHILETTDGKGDKAGHIKKMVRNHKIRDKEGKTDPTLVVTFFQLQVLI